MNFEEIPEISERIKRSKMELQDNGLYWAQEWDSQSCSDQDFVNNFRKGWLARQGEIDHLNSVLEERTKEWLQAIELGDYFENVAEPLKAELDQKDARIKELELKLTIKTRAAEYLERSRAGHRSLAQSRKIEIAELNKKLDEMEGVK